MCDCNPTYTVCIFVSTASLHARMDCTYQHFQTVINCVRKQAELYDRFWCHMCVCVPHILVLANKGSDHTDSPLIVMTDFSKIQHQITILFVMLGRGGGAW